MHEEAGPLRQPVTHFGVHVGAVVINNQMDIQIAWKRLLNLAREARGTLGAGGEVRTG